MLKKQAKLKATITYIIVALLFVAILLGSIQAIFGNQISTAIALTDMISVQTQDKVLSEIKFNSATKRLQKRPEYGTKYATLKIESIGKELPLYFGDNLNILRNGVGQSSGAYFPGEGGSIICMAHNTKAYFGNLPDAQIGDSIHITTPYGEFKYKIYDTQIIHETEVDKVPVQHEEEILMLYTCYPTNGLGNATKRYVVYAKLV